MKLKFIVLLSSSGFFLTELMVVLVIIGVLELLALPLDMMESKISGMI